MGLVAIPKKPTFIEQNKSGKDIYIYNEGVNKVSFEIFTENTNDSLYQSEVINGTDLCEVQLLISEKLNEI